MSEAEQLAKAKKLLKAFCKATNPDNAYGWVYDEMRRMTRREREAAQKFLNNAANDRKQKGDTQCS